MEALWKPYCRWEAADRLGVAEGNFNLETTHGMRPAAKPIYLLDDPKSFSLKLQSNKYQSKITKMPIAPRSFMNLSDSSAASTYQDETESEYYNHQDAGAFTDSERFTYAEADLVRNEPATQPALTEYQSDSALRPKNKIVRREMGCFEAFLNAYKVRQVTQHMLLDFPI